MNKKSRVERVVIAQDEMSESSRVIVSIPPFGSAPDPTELSRHLKAVSLKSIIQEASKPVGEVEEKMSVDEHPSLTQSAFNSGIMALASEVMASAKSMGFDTEDESFVRLTNMCIRLGRMHMDKESRYRFLTDIRREKGQQKSRKTGGENSKRRDTDALIDFMHQKVEAEGFNTSEAARLALDQGLGACTGDPERDKDANRNRYKYWKQKYLQI
ncbi:hypothetical protein [Ruegeria atlantica]|uniref:hypothetical protein n=1 Tax=Ruegeria atlantica TaxID=81569 RepID=UPI002494E6D5|nr:hypothetical protein [Ruegeria atlantica]